MNSRIIQNAAFIKALFYADPLERRQMLRDISLEQIRAISDIAKNILHGRYVIDNTHREKLRQYRSTIRSLASGRISTSRKKRTMLVFHRVIPLLILPILRLLDED